MTTSQYSTEHEIHGEHIEIPIGGMSCGGCAQAVQNALSKLDGVMVATVNHAEAKAQLDFEPERVTVSQIQETIRKAGYEAGEPITTGKPASSQQKQGNTSCCCSKK